MAENMTSCPYARWRISDILDFRGPIMGSLKSPCTTSYGSSIDTILGTWEGSVCGNRSNQRCQHTSLVTVGLSYLVFHIWPISDRQRTEDGRTDVGKNCISGPYAGLENIMIFSKISKYRKYQKYHDIFDIFDIFQKMKISNKLYNNGCNMLMQYLMTILVTRHS